MMREVFASIFCGVAYSYLIWILYFSSSVSTEKPQDLVTEIVDAQYDQIQKGQWLIGFFDKETKESLELEEDWEVFALKCKEQDINAGRVFAPQNPALRVRFVATAFPKVFYIRNGVAHEVKQPTRNTLIDIIKEKKWAQLKPVNFMSNPFSVQMSLLSHLFVHAVNLYNYEDAIVQRYIPFPAATDACFGLTFIIVGTTLGLIFTIIFGLFQFFLDCRSSDEDVDDKTDKPSSNIKETPDTSENECGEEPSPASEDDSSVRKRK